MALRLPALALPQPLSPLRAEANGVGLGEVDAPRGRLMYAVEAHHGLIHSLHLLTPTDWTFHPQGILVQALTGRDDAAVLAPWWLAVLDPCVSCSLSFAVEESPHA
ncbi:Ni,Fe-hydrogenase I large subunit [Pararhodospirillum photometricum DSM 122]|uniref:Ni,Fe-hydrogenase I large subunit n=1 Tax=Pararhodospirillum photometricum DSM 122 TaxID=1150469 RepID=H6SN20_PARPM|nr:Ni,Fe-hydrogenase I large subunit [Pararhodospirillum photometricum DSM 122]